MIFSRNPGRSGLLVLSIALVVTLTSCGGDDSGAPPSTTNPLENVSLGTASATGLSRVAIAGLAPTKALDNLSVLVIVPGIEEFSLPVETDDDGLFFHAPLHPIEPNAGGQSTVRLAQGEHRSEALPLALGPLPPAPGAFLRVVTALQAFIDQQAIYLGTSFEELQGLGFDQVSPSLLPLKFAQSFVDNGTEQDLESLTGPGGGLLSEDERELLDRLFGFAPLDTLIQEQMEAFVTGTAGPESFLPRPNGDGRNKSCFDPGVEISTPQQLSQAMINSKLAEIAIDPDSTPGRTLGAAGTVLSGGALIPGIGGVTFGVVGASLASYQATAAAFSHMYPNRFTKLEYDISQTEFPEDHLGFAVWSEVMVTAASTAWSMDADITNVVLSAVGAFISGSQETALQATAFLRDAGITLLNMGLVEYLGQQPGGIVEICAQEWTVDITGLPWSTGQVMDRHFTVDNERRRIEPAKVGPDFLRIAAQSSQFGGREISKDTPLETKAIIVTIIPDEITVAKAGDSITLDSTIANAVVQELLWKAEAGTWTDGLPAETFVGMDRTLKTPDNPEAYPFLVTAESTTRDGLRSSGLPARVGTAVVRLAAQEVIITPANQCIGLDETIQFLATVPGVPDAEVIWSLGPESQGTIDPDTGLYRASQFIAGLEEVIATVTDQPAITGDTTVRVGACDCYYAFQASGASNYDQSGHEANILVLGTQEDRLLQWNFVDPGTGSYIPLEASLAGSVESPAPQPGDTGTWAINAIYSQPGGIDVWFAANDEESPTLFLNITEYTATHMVGTFTGQCVQRDDPTNPDLITSAVTIDLEFQAGTWTLGERTPCRD